MERRTDQSNQAADIDVIQLFTILWRHKWIVAVFTVITVIGGLTYAFIATEWYRAEILLAPTESRATSNIGGQLGGLLSLAGRSLESANSAEAMAVLESRELATDFIEDLELLHVFFREDWDPSAERWRIDNSSKWPDIRDAVDLFHRDVLSVGKDLETSLVTLTIVWKDPDVAASWANELVRRVNNKMRLQALNEAEFNIDFLTGKLAETNVLTLQQSISDLLESEMQKLMLAQGNKDFSFRVVDRAEPPKYHARPKRLLILISSLFFGLMLGVLAVLVTHASRPFRQSFETQDS